MWTKIFVTFLLCLTAYEVHGAKILGIFPMPAPSHLILGNRLMNALAEKGHQVTFITPLPQKDKVPNLTEIQVTESAKMMEEMKTKNMFDMEADNPFFSAFFVDMIGYEMANATLADSKVQKLLKSNEKFDLIIIEIFNNDVHYGLAHKFQAPVIAFSTIGPGVWTNHLVGNPYSSAYNPDIFLNLQAQMTFKERVFNTVFTSYHWLLKNTLSYWRHNSLLHHYFPDAPALSELTKNTSLLLLNSHVSTNGPVATVPNMIEIGGFHVQPPKKLPKDLQEYLDNAKEGVVYFSMGSNLKSAQLPVAKREAILKVFSKLKQKVLWKWEEDNLPNQPANVKISKWFPQQDILAHPNVKVFITHGGLLSSIEAIYHGVPLIGIPIFGDQKMNVAGAVRNGYALAVPYSSWSETNLGWALNEIVNNPKYKKNAKTRSQIMQDQPVKPLDSAVYWVEYVLRHKGASHFRSPVLDLYWFEYLLADVTLFLIVDVIVLSLVFYMICAKMCCGKKTASSASIKKVTDKKKKN